MELQDQFNRVSRQYDSQRKKLIPGFEDYYTVAIENLDLDNPTPVVADLGAGTGLMAQKVLERYPAARITLFDISEKMLEVALRRFTGMPNVEIETSDLTTLQLTREYDAIVSSLAIHHLTDKEKYTLYNKSFEALKENGVFLNVEQVLADTPALQERYAKKWKERVESTDLSSGEIAAAYERVKLDKRTPLTTQLTWLKEIGFRQTDCLYKFYDFCVIWAIK